MNEGISSTSGDDEETSLSGDKRKNKNDEIKNKGRDNNIEEGITNISSNYKKTNISSDIGKIKNDEVKNQDRDKTENTKI